MSGLRAFVGRASLRTKLIISYLLLLLLPLSLLAGFSSAGIERLLVAQSHDAYQGTVRQTALNIESAMEGLVASTDMIRGNQQLLNALRVLRIRSLSLGEEYDYYHRIRANIDTVLHQAGTQRVRLAIDGAATFVSDSFDIFRLESLRGDEAWPLLANRVTWLPSSAFSNARIDDADTLQLCIRINDTSHQATVLGYMLVEVNALSLFRSMERLTLSPGSFLQLWAGDALLREIRNPAAGSPPDEEARFAWEAPLSYADWRLVLSIPRDNVLRFGDNLPSTILWMATILSVVGIAFAIAVTRSINVRLQTTLQGIRAIEGGELGITVPVQGSDEYSTVQVAFNHMSLRIQALLEDLIHSQAQQKQAEMRLLYEQINPHFIYNTLDVIRWEALRTGAVPLAKVSDMLVAYLRLSLNHGQEMITVRREMDMVASYLHIMNFRYQDAITYTEDIAPDIADAQMIKMILQPLVENAVVHGIMGTQRKRGRIAVRGWRVGHTLCFSVTDDGAGMTQEQLDTALLMDAQHYGLRNVHKRLQTYYGEAGGLTLASVPGEAGCVVTVAMPGAMAADDATGEAYEARNEERGITPSRWG